MLELNNCGKVHGRRPLKGATREGKQSSKWRSFQSCNCSVTFQMSVRQGDTPLLIFMTISFHIARSNFPVYDQRILSKIQRTLQQRAIRRQGPKPQKYITGRQLTGKTSMHTRISLASFALQAQTICPRASG